MDVFIYFIPITILIASVMLVVLLWSIKSNQYDDLKQKGENLLFIDERDKK
jgi:cbb3-type cytochrome oxidase maturation protein